MSAIIEFKGKIKETEHELRKMGYETILVEKNNGEISAAVRYVSVDNKKIREINDELERIEGVKVIAASVRPDECERLLKSSLPC
jgi:hypothetical protein